MNLVTFLEVSRTLPNVPVESNPEYNEADVIALKNNQIGIASIEQIDVNYIGDPVNVTAIIGVDSAGRQMNMPWHGVILPCPPYCPDDPSGLSPKNNNPAGSNSISFIEARDLF